MISLVGRGRYWGLGLDSLAADYERCVNAALAREFLSEFCALVSATRIAQRINCASVLGCVDALQRQHFVMTPYFYRICHMNDTLSPNVIHCGAFHNFLFSKRSLGLEFTC